MAAGFAAGPLEGGLALAGGVAEVTLEGGLALAGLVAAVALEGGLALAAGVAAGTVVVATSPFLLTIPIINKVKIYIPNFGGHHLLLSVYLFL